MARAYSGCQVWHQDFPRLNLPDQRFDGIFANTTLFHVPSRKLPRVLRELHAALRPEGFASNFRSWSREAGIENGMALITISMLGAVFSRRWDFWNLTAITGLSECPASSNPDWLPPGARNEWFYAEAGLVLSPDGRRYALGDVDGNLRLWGNHTGCLLGESRYSGWVAALASERVGGR